MVLSFRLGELGAFVVGYTVPPMPPEVRESLERRARLRRELEDRQLIRDIAYILSLEPWLPKYLSGEIEKLLPQHDQHASVR